MTSRLLPGRSPCRSRPPIRGASPPRRRRRPKVTATCRCSISRTSATPTRPSRTWFARPSPNWVRTLSSDGLRDSSLAAADSSNGHGPLRYRRILLKLSGEALQGSAAYGIDSATVESIARQVAAVAARGVQVGMVIGGGNIWRGEPAATRGMDRPTADNMGMLATVINGLALQSGMERVGLHTRVQSAVTMTEVCEPYIRRRAIRHFEKGRVVIFVAR